MSIQGYCRGNDGRSCSPMILVSCEAFSQILLSHAGIEFGQYFAPSDRRMLDDNANKGLRWAGGIAVIVGHRARYGVTKPGRASAMIAKARPPKSQLRW